MAFNPDEYLSQKPASASSFDPDSYLSGSKKGMSKAKADKIPTIDNLGRQAAQGLTAGFSDEIIGGLYGAPKGAIDYISGNSKAPGLLDAIKEGYSSTRDAERQKIGQGFNESPISSTVSQIAGSIPSMAALPASLPSYLAQGAIAGFGGSTDRPVQDTLTGGLVSGAAGKAGQMVGSGVTSVLDKIKIQEALKALGAQKTQLKGMPQQFKTDTAQYALDNGLINPLQGTATKQAANTSLNSATGQRLDAVRDTLPSVPKQDAINAVNSKINFNPDLEVNAPLTAQRDMILRDIGNLGKTEGPLGPTEGKINAKDLLDLKSAIFNMSRKSNGEINPAKDVLEQSRQGISSLEKKVANSGAYNKDLKDYAIGKKIENLLGNRASQEGNSMLGMGGLVGGGGAIAALASDRPELALLGALGLPAMRSKIGESAAKSIYTAQKLSKKLGVSTEQAAFLLSKLNSNKE